MKLVEQNRIEEELSEEKQRFVQASKRAARAIKTDINLFNWIKQFPTESAVAIIAVGFAVGYVIQQSRQKRSAEKPA
jgi:hypothetical protein